MELDLDLDNLTAVRVLGRGATGTVFLVSDRSSASLPPFALKVVDKHSPSDKPDADRRARWELSVLRSLLADPHPFLPTLLGSADTPDLLAYATPFCPASDLNSLRHSLSPDRVFSTAAIRFYLSELTAALAHLHSLRIVYRDLKPENVLIQSNGHITLTDFDLSRCLRPLPCSLPPPSPSRLRRRCRSLTSIFSAPIPSQQKVRVSPVSRRRIEVEKSRSFVGTEEYVAPEVVKGEGHEFSVDWWAMGILAYEMAYGRTPFRGRNRKETFRNVLTRRPEFVGKHTPELTNLIAGLLEKEPERRLGYSRGAEQVKAQPFFEGVKWEMLAEVERPPFLPKAEDLEDGDVGSPAGGFDIREKLKKMRQKEAAAAAAALSPAALSLTEF